MTALGASTALDSTEVNSNATLIVDGGINIASEPLYLTSGAVPALDSRSGSNVWGGPIVLNQTTSLSVSNTGVLNVLNAVSGSGGLQKIGGGTLTFRGTLANTYAGPTTVSAGLLDAARTNVITVPGDVLVGDDSTTNVLATLRLSRDQQMKPTANVSLGSSGMLDLFLASNPAPPNQHLRTMTGHGQVHVDFLATLTITNDVPFDFYGNVNAPNGQVFNKYGTGILRAWGNWNCPNGIVIHGGDFWFNGTTQGADIYSGARLRGDGHFTSGVSIEPGGFLAVDSMFPDHQGGDIDAPDLELNAGAQVTLDLYGPSPTGGNDTLNVQTAGLASANLAVNFNYPPREGDVIKLINKTAAGAISGTFSGWPTGMKQLGTVPVLVNYAGGDGNDLTLTVTNLAMAYVGYRLAEGNGNQTVEPNECNLLYVTLVNRRGTALTISNAFLRATTTNGALVTVATAGYPVIAAGNSSENTNAFQFRTDTNLPCGTAVSFELVLTVSGEGQFAVPFTLVPGADCTQPTGPCESCTVAGGQFSTNTPAMPLPLYFTGAPSICYPPKAYPGIDPNTNLVVAYLTHSFTNSTTNNLCLSAQLQYPCPGAPTNSLGVAAYLGGFNPADPSAGYLGDTGVGGPPYPAFSFQVPAGSNFVLVVAARITNLVCNSYSLEVFGLPCPQPALGITNEAAPNTVRVNWSTAYPGWTAQQSGAMSGTFTNVTQPPAIVGGRYSITNIGAVTNQFYRLKK